MFGLFETPARRKGFVCGPLAFQASMTGTMWFSSDVVEGGVGLGGWLRSGGPAGFGTR